MFKGALVALITPMREDGSVDEKAYADFVDWQIKEGTHAVVPVGTTGESPTLSHDEHRRVVEIAIEVAKSRFPIIAGAGSNSTEEAIATIFPKALPRVNWRLPRTPAKSLWVHPIWTRSSIVGRVRPSPRASFPTRIFDC